MGRLFLTGGLGAGGSYGFSISMVSCCSSSLRILSNSSSCSILACSSFSSRFTGVHSNSGFSSSDSRSGIGSSASFTETLGVSVSLASWRLQKHLPGSGPKLHCSFLAVRPWQRISLPSADTLTLISRFLRGT